jgi:hypothetical protein
MDELGGELVELAGVIDGERAQDTIARRGEFEDDVAAVFEVLPADEQASGFAAVAEFDDAVVTEGQTAGEIAHRRYGPSGRAGDLKQELMLLRRETGARCGFFAEVEESAEREAEFCEGADAGFRYGLDT